MPLTGTGSSRGGWSLRPCLALVSVGVSLELSLCYLRGGIP